MRACPTANQMTHQITESPAIIAGGKSIVKWHKNFLGQGILMTDEKRPDYSELTDEELRAHYMAVVLELQKRGWQMVSVAGDDEGRLILQFSKAPGGGIVH